MGRESRQVSSQASAAPLIGAGPGLRTATSQPSRTRGHLQPQLMTRLMREIFLLPHGLAAALRRGQRRHAPQAANFRGRGSRHAGGSKVSSLVQAQPGSRAPAWSASHIQEVQFR